jgi:hypothetical protein
MFPGFLFEIFDASFNVCITRYLDPTDLLLFYFILPFFLQERGLRWKRLPELQLVEWHTSETWHSVTLSPRAAKKLPLSYL